MRWCGEEQPSSVEITGVKLASATVHPRHMNSQWGLRTGQLNCFMRSFGWSTNTPLWLSCLINLDVEKPFTHAQLKENSIFKSTVVTKYGDPSCNPWTCPYATTISNWSERRSKTATSQPRFPCQLWQLKVISTWELSTLPEKTAMTT